MSVPREDSDGAVPRAAAPEPPGGVSPEETESREELTIEAKDVREAIRFGHVDAKERFREFDERCETAGWGRRIADRLFLLLHREDAPQGPSTFSMALTASVRAFRELANWRGPARRALERLGSLPESVGILPVLEAERDARVRLEEAEAAKARAETERDEAEQAETKMLSAVGAVRTLFERARGGKPTTEEDVSDVLRGIGAMRNERADLENAWNAWNQAGAAEAKASERLKELGAFRNRTLEKNDGVFLDEARKDLAWSPAVSDAAKAADAAAVTLAKWHALAPAKPVVDNHPVPWPPFRAMVRERMRAKWIPEFDHVEWRWLLLSFVPIVVGWMMCATGEWIVLPGAGLILCGAGVAVYNVWDCDWNDFPLSMVFDGKGKAPFPFFAGFLFGLAAGWILRHWTGWTTAGWLATAAGIGVLACGAAAAARAGAKVAAGKRMRRELLSVRAKWLSGEIAKRWPDPETEQRWNSLRSDQEPLSGQRDACSENGTSDSVRIDRWRALWNRLESLRAWDADHAQWDVRRQALLDEASDRVRDVRDAVDAVARDAVQLRSMHRKRTAAAEEAVETALAAAEKSAAAFPAAVALARAAAETAAHGADAARRAWEDAKAATDAVVAKAEEAEKRRAEVRIEFARLKDRTAPAIRARLESVRSSPDATDELVRRTAGLETDLSEWVRQEEPANDGLPGEERRAAEWKERIGHLENELLGLRHEKAERFFREAGKAFRKQQFGNCIAAADECLAREPGREDAKRLADDARREIGRLETEIEQWKAWASSAVELENLDPREPVFRTIARKVSARQEELRGLSDWQDHEKARSCKREIERLLNEWKVSFARMDRRYDFEKTYQDVCANLQTFADAHGTLGRPAWEIEWESGDERFTKGKPEEAFNFYERAIHVAKRAVEALEYRARMLSSAEETIKTVNLRRSFLLNDAPSFSEEEFERDVRDGSAAILSGRFQEAQNRLLAVSRRLEQLSEACERLLEECYNKRFSNRVLQEAGHEAFLHVAVSIQRQIFGTEVDHDPEISASRPPECPWMPPTERRRLPDPVAFVRIVRDFDEAGSLYARLWSSAVRWSEQWNESVFLVPGEDVGSDRHKERLVDAMRHLVRLDASPSDSLKEIEREFAWFLETSPPRREWATRKKEWDDILKGPARKAFDSALSQSQASAEKAKGCVSKARSAVLSGDYAAAEALLRTAVSLGPELTANGWVVICRNKQEEVGQAGAPDAEIAEIVERFDGGMRKLDESCFDDAIRIFEIVYREYAVLHERTACAHKRATQCLGRADRAVSRLDELSGSDSDEPFKIRTGNTAETVRTYYEKRNWKSAIDAFRPLERAEQEIDFRKCRVELEDERRKLRECGLESEAESINRILSALDEDSFREIPEAEVTTPQSVIQSAENQIDRFASSLVQSWMQRHPDDLWDAESWSDLEQTIDRAPSFLRNRRWRISDDRYIHWHRRLAARPLVRLFCREWDASGLDTAIDPKAVLSILRSPYKKEILDCLAGADAYDINGLNLLARIAEPPYDRKFTEEAGLRKWRHG